MDTGSLVYAYAAAATVAVLVTAAFSPAINRVLDNLIPEEVSPAWAQFIKFALFVSAFVGGMPNANPGRFIDRNGPAVTPPVEGEALMMVMRTIGGALMAASRMLLVFFGTTLAAYAAIRFWAAVKQRREAEATEVERREKEHLEAKARQDASPSPEPRKRQEPAEARPVRKESAAAK